MFIVISHQDPAPLYQQVFDQIVDAVTAGTLNAGDKLPSIREVTAELKISEITVKRAYTDLEHGGYIITRPGRGSFVAEINRETLREKKLARLRTDLEALLKSNEKYGIRARDIIALIKEIKENRNG